MSATEGGGARTGDGAQQAGEWQIAQTAKACRSCNAPFLPGEDYWSSLHVETQQEQGDDAAARAVLVRYDSCTRCWAAKDDRIYWKTRRNVDKGDKNVVDIASMHQLFLQLLEDDRDEIEALRYVVGLMLARKKVIKVIRNAGGARGDLVFRDPRKEGERVRLPSPALREEELERLKSQLGEILA